MQLENFTKIGLSEREAKIYNTLLVYGELNLGNLSKLSDIQRTTAYGVVDTLIEKGLVERARHKKQYLYYASDPRDYLEVLKQKKAKINEIIPGLIGLMPNKKNKVDLLYFEGENCYKDIFRDSLKFPDTETVSWRANNMELDDAFLDTYMQERVAKDIALRIITNKNSKTSEKLITDPLNKRQTKYVNEDAPIEVEIIIYGNDHAAIFSVESKMGLIIINSYIHQTLRSIFELNWESLR